MEEKNTFNCTYSAKQQEEIRGIQCKYLSQEEDKLAQLRRLDRNAARPGATAAIAIGVIGSLLLGVGLCCTMLWPAYFALGIAAGVAGIAAVAVAYPVYLFLCKRCRARLAPEILRLSEELMVPPQR